MKSYLGAKAVYGGVSLALPNLCTSSCRRGMPASPVYTGLRDYTPPRAAPHLRTSGSVVWLNEGRHGGAAASPCACAWAVRLRGPSQEKQSRAGAGSAGAPGAGVLRAPSGTAAAERRRALPRGSGAGLGWAGLGSAREGSPAGPTVTHRPLPAPSVPGEGEIPRDSRLDSGGRKRPRNRLSLERAAGPRHQIPSRERKRGTLS